MILHFSATGFQGVIAEIIGATLALMSKRSSEYTRAIFRGLWSFANGAPCASYYVCAGDDKSGAACLDSKPGIEVAVRKRSSKLEFGTSALNAAYETFLDEGEGSDNLEWVTLSEV
ncbi:MAG: hypothetical protein WCB53_09050 [Terriglobales bacterium]